jgi:hypothetical protein
LGQFGGKAGEPTCRKAQVGNADAFGQGVVKMLKAEVSLSLLLPEFDARRLNLVVLDYIRAWSRRISPNSHKRACGSTAGERAQASAPDHTPLPAAVGTAPSPTVLSQPGSPLERSGAPSRNGPENRPPRRHRPSGHAATDSQVAFLAELATDLGHRGERARLWLAEQGDETPVERLTRAQASELIERLLAMREIASSASSP